METRIKNQVMEYLIKSVEKTQIVLRPNELTNIQSNLEKKIRKKVGTCSKEKGYIIMIHNIQRDKKLQNIISRVSGNCIFTVSYDICSLKPEIGHVYKVLVSSIFKEGIFCEYNNIKILIPNSELQSFSYQNEKLVSPEYTIQTGDWIKIRIHNVRYDDQNYQCIARLEE